MPDDVIKHVAASCKLHHNRQVGLGQEQLSELHNVWVRNAQPACNEQRLASAEEEAFKRGS